MSLDGITPELTLYLAMVFGAVFLLAQSLVVPAFGDSRKAERRVRKRLQQIASHAQRQAIRSLLRDKYLHSLSPLERRLESLPGMESLNRWLEQAGHRMPAYRLVLISVVLALGAGVLVWTATRQIPATAMAGLIAGWLPFFKVGRDRARRIALFEQQLPDAVDVIKRAVRAGHPFSEALNLVGEELEDPVAREFRLTFADLNYGNDLRSALLGLLERVPSMTVTALVTSVLIQKETGGNLAEILDQLGRLIRSRFRFYRRVRTLSAEGRMSAWILALIPFALFAVIWITTPSYLPTLLEQPLGRKLITGAALLMLAGILWIRRIIRIEV
jgi:tight adherence protein B